jgi:hypothetical protein
MNKALFVGVAILSLLVNKIHAHEILVNTSDGEVMTLDVNPSETIQELQDKIAMLADGRKSPITMSLTFDEKGDFENLCLHMARQQGQYLGYPRNYFAEVLPEEKKDIRFIISFLAKEDNYINIMIARGRLEAAGDRIDHLHPLRFLMTVFSDEELKALIRNVRSKGLVWNPFVGGLKASLATETSIGNMKPEYIQHFSEKLNISPNLISDSIYSEMWDEFVDLLIAHIPRKGDYDRYDS